MIGLGTGFGLAFKAVRLATANLGVVAFINPRWLMIFPGLCYPLDSLAILIMKDLLS